MQINQIKLQNKIKVTCFNYLQIQLIRPIDYMMALRAQVSVPSAPWSVCPQAHATVREELVLHSLDHISYINI